MDELVARFWGDLVGRASGPMSLRLFLQPCIATFLAIRAGMQDARTGRPLYTLTVLTDASHRVEFLRAGWKNIAKVYTVAVVLDIVYQWIVFRWVYPIESLVVAFVLACLPYLLIRGPVNRLMRRRVQRGTAS